AVTVGAKARALPEGGQQHETWPRTAHGSERDRRGIDRGTRGGATAVPVGRREGRRALLSVPTASPRRAADAGSRGQAVTGSRGQAVTGSRGETVSGSRGETVAGPR